MSGHITLAHGAGGQLTNELIRSLFLRYFLNPVLSSLGDSAVVEGFSGRLAITTDAFVVQPLFFPGGDIGRLAICGTVNDLAVAGARPMYLSAGFIIAEGFAIRDLERIVCSMAETARLAGVAVVAGDTKVVPREAADGLFITTAGVGWMRDNIDLSPAHLQPGDVILTSGTLGDHGMAVMMQREGLEFGSSLISDCAPLNGLIDAVLNVFPAGVRCMRDPTRGGLTAALNEWAAFGVGIEIEEEAIPIRPQVRAICEVLGLDPLQAANEGKVIIAADPRVAPAVLEALREHPLGREAAVIGHVSAEHPGRVALRTALGSRRVLEMPVGIPLPRIC